MVEEFVLSVADIKAGRLELGQTQPLTAASVRKEPVGRKTGKRHR